MKITTGPNDFEILDAGTVISFKDEIVTFKLADDLKIAMRFKNDKSVSEQKMDFVEVNSTSLEIILTNFNNPLGTGNAAPLALAKINGKRVYLNFIVHALDETANKSIHYTWYLREDAV